jgi:hypothetical protein
MKLDLRLLEFLQNQESLILGESRVR